MFFTIETDALNYDNPVDYNALQFDLKIEKLCHHAYCDVEVPLIIRVVDSLIFVIQQCLPHRWLNKHC